MPIIGRSSRAAIMIDTNGFSGDDPDCMLPKAIMSISIQTEYTQPLVIRRTIITLIFESTRTQD